MTESVREATATIQSIASGTGNHWNSQSPFDCFRATLSWLLPRIDHQRDPATDEQTVNVDDTVRASYEPAESGELRQMRPNDPEPTSESLGHFFEIDSNFLSIDETRVVGRGGSSIVLEGKLFCAGAHLPVAVKKLTIASSEEEQKMLRDELKILSVATARCTRTCRLMGVCTVSGRVCIVTRLYQTSLAGLLLSYPGRKLSLSHALRLSADVCAALVELHRAHIVHQDVKPSNLLLDESGNLVIADFGISECLSTICSRCMPSRAVGTPHYMSPEAFDPAEYGGITSATDMWSMGCCTLQMLQGKPPWDGMRPQQISRQVCDKLSKPSITADIPTILADLLHDCFSSPAARPTAIDAHARILNMKIVGDGTLYRM